MLTVENDVLGSALEPGANMLVIPPGLSEEEEALQKKFNKLKKKVRGLGWWGSLSQTLRMPGAGVRRRGSPGSYPEYTSSRRNFPSIVFSAQSPHGIMVIPVALVLSRSRRLSPLDSQFHPELCEP